MPATPVADAAVSPTADRPPSGLTPVEPMTSTLEDAAAQEKRGRRWVIWSFILCPCHLPVTLGVLGVVFGGSAIGPLISRYSWGVAIVLTAVYAVALGIGLRHVRNAEKVRACAEGACDLPGA